MPDYSYCPMCFAEFDVSTPAGKIVLNTHLKAERVGRTREVRGLRVKLVIS
jgi:hypothetical protein